MSSATVVIGDLRVKDRVRPYIREHISSLEYVIQSICNNDYGRINKSLSSESSNHPAHQRSLVNLC